MSFTRSRGLMDEEGGVDGTSWPFDGMETLQMVGWGSGSGNSISSGSSWLRSSISVS